MNSRDARRMMQQMGMRFEEVRDVYQVVIKMASKEIIIDEPEVAAMEVQGQRVYQVVGGRVSEKGAQEKEVSIPEEDVQLVAQQAKVTPEEARKALEETGGDLAQAILILSTRRG